MRVMGREVGDTHITSRHIVIGIHIQLPRDMYMGIHTSQGYTPAPAVIW